MATLGKAVKNVQYFVQRFWPLICWMLFTTIIFWRTYTNFNTRPQYYYLRTILGWWLCISRGTAPVLTMCSLLVLLPVCRSLHTVIHGCLAKISSTLLAAWLSRIKIMHMVCATTLIIFSIVHTGAHVMNAIYFSKHYTALYPDINLARYKGENPALLICTWTGCTGIVMLVLLLLMGITSTTKFRMKHFNAFYLIHHLFVLYLLLLLTHPLSGVLKEQYNVNQHIPGCIVPLNTTKPSQDILKETTVGYSAYCKQPPKFKCIATQSWIWVLTALIIYAIELGYRKFHGSSMEAIQACPVIKNAIHLRLKSPKDFQVSPGQYILLQCNQISSIEWHPFSVTRCPDNNCQSFELLISVRGDWTKNLQTLIKTPFAFNECNSYISRLYHSPLKFLVDGPFASPMQSMKTSNLVVCVAAGIGITSFIATLRYMLTNETTTPKRLHLFWLTRDTRQFCWFEKLICDLHNKFWNQNQPDRFQIQLFVTKVSKKTELDSIIKNPVLKSRISFGRPNWKEEFRILNFINQRQKVSLFCCGPKSLNKELRKRCYMENRKGYSYKYIHEGF